MDEALSLTQVTDKIIAALCVQPTPQAIMKMRRIIAQLGLDKVRLYVSYAQAHPPAERYRAFIAMTGNQTRGVPRFRKSTRHKKKRTSPLSAATDRQVSPSLEKLMRRSKGIV